MPDYDIVIRNGLIYDGSGSAPYQGDLAIQGDTIGTVGSAAHGKVDLDVKGMAVAPGFINMMSWAPESLIADGSSQSDIRQGVTLEVMGEGLSMGPLSEPMKQSDLLAKGDIQYAIEWTTLGEYLEYLVRRGVSPNVASFVGSSSLRIHAIGYEDRPPTATELDSMRKLTRQAMEEGAVGLSTALIYPPASYAQTEELIALAQVAADYGGMYISHLRSEGAFFLQALDELLTISQRTGSRAEVYHLKAAGQANWPKMDQAIQRIEAARAAGQAITADMYLYAAGGTGLDSVIPPWAHDGGPAMLIQRLKDPAIREQIKLEIGAPSDTWENMWQAAGSADRILLAGFRTEALKPLTGKTLAEVAVMRGTSPEDTAFDLLIEDESRIFTVYFMMSEENVAKQIAFPWVCFCSDAESIAPEGVFLKSNPHPRAYGSFARLLGHYVRDKAIIPLEEAIRRLTSFPAANLRIERRGSLLPGYFADIVVFDPATIQDNATFERPHQYATGMKHVFVNGVQVLADGEHTGAKPGRIVRGPGYRQS